MYTKTQGGGRTESSAKIRAQLPFNEYISHRCQTNKYFSSGPLHLLLLFDPGHRGAWRPGLPTFYSHGADDVFLYFLFFVFEKELEKKQPKRQIGPESFPGLRPFTPTHDDTQT